MDLFWSLPDSRDFAGLTAPLDSLFGSAQTRRYEAGASISDPEVAPQRAFRCVSGTIKVTKLLASGREILITILQTGSVWSDRAVLNGYLNTPGITGLTGPDRDVIRNLVALFELVRSLRPA